MNVNNFIELLKKAEITSEFNDNYNEPDILSDSEDNQYAANNYVRDAYVYGVIWKNLLIPGMECVIDTNYNHPTGHPSQLFDSEKETNFQFLLLEFDVFDDDGDQLEEYELEQLILQHTDMCTFDWSILGTDEDNIEFTGPNVPPPEGFELVELVCTNSGDQHFIGREIASASDHEYGGYPRWYEFTIYELLDGSYACYKIHATDWYYENDKKHVEFYNTLLDIKNKLPDCDAAESIYQQLEFQ